MYIISYIVLVTHTSSLLQEYDWLTKKVHELQLKEQDLLEQLSNERSSPINTPVDTPPGDIPHVFPTVTPSPETTPNLPGIPQTPVTAPVTGQGSPHLAQRSPLRTALKAFLPNHQKTVVSSDFYNHANNVYVIRYWGF